MGELRSLASGLVTGEFGAHEVHDVDVGEFGAFDEQGNFAGAIDGPVANEWRAGRELDAVIQDYGTTDHGTTGLVLLVESCRRPALHAPDHVDTADHEAVTRGHARAEGDELFGHIQF